MKEINKKADKSELDKQRSIVNKKTVSMLKSVTDMSSELLTSKASFSDSKLKEIRSLVDSSAKTSAEVAELIGDVINSWIYIQVAYANLYHFDGYETNLISTSIFEKSKESMGKLRASLNLILTFDKAITPATSAKISENITGVLASIDSPGLDVSETCKKEIKELLSSSDWKEVFQVYMTA